MNEQVKQIRAEIERRKKYLLNTVAHWPIHRVVELESLLSFIDSLPEQPVEKTCKTCGFYENNCPFIRDKFIPYPNKVCKDYTYSVMKAQEQPVEGLEEEIDDYIKRKWYDDEMTYYWPQLKRMARHFAEWGAKHLKK